MDLLDWLTLLVLCHPTIANLHHIVAQSMWPQESQSDDESRKEFWRILGLQSVLKGQRSWVSISVKDGSKDINRVDALISRKQRWGGKVKKSFLPDLFVSRHTLMDLTKSMFLSWSQTQASWHPRLSNTSVKERCMWAHNLYRHVIIYFSIAVITYSDKRNLRERTFVLFVWVIVEATVCGGEGNQSVKGLKRLLTLTPQLRSRG